MCFNKKIKIILRGNVLIITCLLFFLSVSAQEYKSGVRKNYISGGNPYYETFHAISAQVAFDLSTMPFFGMGYTCMQLSHRGNDMIQENINYSAGFHLKHKDITHAVTVSVHSNHIHLLSLNPFVYGLALQFVSSKDHDDVYNNLNTNEYPGKLMSNVYIRPEVGFSIPLKQDKKITSCLITYGYGFQTFWKREEVKKYQEEVKEKNIDGSLTPYTSQNHHFVNVRLNFRIIPKNSRVYFK
ncbi:MAG: hypothetical protein GX330_05005 [Bacteroidales bacterium]|nr:hypothetical protein [Bacteroidales bacterium]